MWAPGQGRPAKGDRRRASSEVHRRAGRRDAAARLRLARRRRADRAPAGQRQRQAAAAARSVDSIVLISSIVMVIGPTPPGTGVM